RLWGKAALVSCGLLFLLFIAWFDHPAGNFAFGLLLSIHISGFVYYCSPLLLDAPFRSRLLFTLLALMGIGLLIYLPIRNVILQHWLVPLRVRGNVGIVHRLGVPYDIKRGDWVMYSQNSKQTGERLYDWALMQLSKQDGWTRALLLRRSIEEKPECAYYLCYAPTGKDTIETLVRVAGQRWLIEQSFETAKGECGLDHYEVRHWHGWYRHITLSMLAHAVLSVLRARGEKNSPRASAAQRTRTAPPAHRNAVARVARY